MSSFTRPWLLIIVFYGMGLFKQKCLFEDTQNAQIQFVLRMRQTIIRSFARQSHKGENCWFSRFLSSFRGSCCQMYLSPKFTFACFFSKPSPLWNLVSSASGPASRSYTLHNASCTFVRKYNYITKTRLFKYIENFTTKKWKLSDEKFW